MTAPTVELNFVIANNQTWENQFHLSVDGDAGDIITQSKVHLTVRPSASSPDVTLEASIDNGRITVDDAPGGLVTLTIHGTAMRKIKAGDYVYDLLVERPTGRIYRLFAGNLSLLAGVTEPTVSPPVT